MSTSEDYLREHNIKSVALIAEGTFAPVMLIKIDEEELRVHMTQDKIEKARNGDISAMDETIEEAVHEYERDKKLEERRYKFDIITKKMNNNEEEI